MNGSNDDSDEKKDESALDKMEQVVVMKKEPQEETTQDETKVESDLKDVIKENGKEESSSDETKIKPEATAEEVKENKCEELPTPAIVTPQPKAVRWPKDRVLQMRLEQIVHCVEKNEWPSHRHNFYSSVAGPLPSTPSIATADSSPRAISPSSLSNMSREPTPHPTPEHTPRRDTISPQIPDYLFDHSDESRQKKKRRRRRYDATPDMEPPKGVSLDHLRRFSDKGFAAKLRNLLSQNMDQSAPSNFPNFQQQSLSQPKHLSSSSSKKGSSLLNHSSSSFLPPLFNLPFMNLRADIRNELLNDEKTASIILGNLTRNQGSSSTGLSSPAHYHDRHKSSDGASKAPPPAHQPPPAHSSVRNRNSAPPDTMDLRFKTTPVLVPPPAPAHHKAPSKHVSRAANPEQQDARRSSASPLPVLDLSSGSVPKRSNRASASSASPKSSAPTGSGSRKRIGSRIDALALNLQAKKMMEEKPLDEPKEERNFLTEIAQKSESRKGKGTALDLLLGSRKTGSNQPMSSLNFPPAAHSSAPSATHSNSAQSKFSSLSESLFGKNRSTPNTANDSKLPQSKPSEANSILETAAAIRQDLKKWLEDHPEFVAANPTLAAAAAAAMSFNPPQLSSSTIPPNVCILLARFLLLLTVLLID